MNRAKVEFLGTEYDSPVFLASGILGQTADSLIHCHKAGAGCAP